MQPHGAHIQSGAQAAHPAAWSFTGPPPGMPAHPQALHFYQAYPPMGVLGMPMQPGMAVPMHPAPHGMPPSHPPPAHWMRNMAQPVPMHPAAAAAAAAAAAHVHPQAEKKYANKKEREKAKKERKEARKLAGNPLQPLTEDAQPRPFLNDGERQETLQWIQERKARFPTRERMAAAAAQADSLAQAGGSEGPSACDSRLFSVLQEQHRLGLLRSAGTEDLYRSLGKQGGGRGAGGRGAGSKRGRGRGRGRGQWQQHEPGPAATSSISVAAAATAGGPAYGAGPTEPPTASMQEVAGTAAQAAQAVAPPAGEQLHSKAAPMHDADTAVTDAAALQRDGAENGQNISDAGKDGCHNVETNIDEQQMVCVAAAQQHTAKRKMDGVPGTAGQAGARKAAKGQGGWQRAQLQQHRGSSKPCLLHRLLAPDVRQDRSLLLQAFRFFVANDFLQSVTKPLQFPDTAH